MVQEEGTVRIRYRERSGSLGWSGGCVRRSVSECWQIAQASQFYKGH